MLSSFFIIAVLLLLLLSRSWGRTGASPNAHQIICPAWPQKLCWLFSVAALIWSDGEWKRKSKSQLLNGLSLCKPTGGVQVPGAWPCMGFTREKGKKGWLRAIKTPETSFLLFVFRLPFFVVVIQLCFYHRNLDLVDFTGKQKNNIQEFSSNWCVFCSSWFKWRFQMLV